MPKGGKKGNCPGKDEVEAKGDSPQNKNEG